MSQAPQFVISEFTNPSGEIVFRVTGWLDGKRIRKSFPSRAEASAERQTLEIQSIQSTTGVRTIATRLSDEQLHEAEALFRRMEGTSRPLSCYVDFALSSYRSAGVPKALRWRVVGRQLEGEESVSRCWWARGLLPAES